VAERQEVVWATPVAGGLLGLVLALVVLAPYFANWMGPDTAFMLFPWLIVSGLAQFLVGIIEFRRGDIILATPFFAFGFLIVFGLALSLGWRAWGAGAGVELNPNIEGWVLLFFALMVAMISFGVGRISWLLTVALLIAALALLLISLFILIASQGWEVSNYLARVGGVLIGVFGAIVFYAASALYLNAAFARPLLPLGKPLFK